MILFDVNVFVYAHREDGPDFAAYHDWLETTLRSSEAFGVADLVLSGFIRIVTNPAIFAVPTPLAVALSFVERIRNHPHCVSVAPGDRHWSIFLRLCREAAVRGNLVSDAYLAALAIESGSEWITTDRDFARFPGLRWRHPFS